MNHMIRNSFALLSLIASSMALAGPVNVNTADARSIAKELDGIGKARAEQIVAYREAHGPFTAPEQLARVKGVGKKTVDKNRELILID